MTGNLILFGGKDNVDNTFGDTWSWNGSQWTQVSATGPDGRFLSSLAPDVAGGLLLFGGNTFVNSYPIHAASGDSWRWLANQWTLVEDRPILRRGPALAYDEARHHVVSYGGYSPMTDGTWRYLLDTWLFDGSQWRQTGAGPTLRTDAACAYDAQRARVVVFGGRTSNNFASGDTYVWDGTRWSIAARSGPSARYGSAMVFDDNASQLVLFGGRAITGPAFGDTWGWDGATWRILADTGPSARTLAQIAYDEARGVTVLSGDGSHNEDTWEWDGVSWTMKQAVGSPCADGGHMFYDPVLEAVLCIKRTVPEDGTVRSFVWNGQEWIDQGPLSLPPFHSYSTYYYWDTLRNQAAAVDPWHGETWSYAAEMVLKRNPSGQTIPLHAPARFEVQASGRSSLAYQWRRNGIPLADDGRIAGSNSPTLSISPTFSADAGNYDVVISGPCDPIISAPATLSFASGISLIVDATCPAGGPISVSWSGATPTGQIALIFARNTGSFVIPSGNPCSGTILGLGANQLQLAYQGGAGANGSKNLNSNAAPGACGGYLQLLDQFSCGTSNVAVIN